MDWKFVIDAVSGRLRRGDDRLQPDIGKLYLVDVGIDPDDVSIDPDNDSIGPDDDSIGPDDDGIDPDNDSIGPDDDSIDPDRRQHRS